MRRGDKGAQVAQVQTWLTELGYDLGRVDGIFGAQTEAAVCEFQRRNLLQVDGIVGVKTMAALEKTTDNGQRTTDNGQQSAPEILLRPITRHMGYSRRARKIEYIVIHYTAGASSAPGRAEQTRNGFQNSDRQASADFCVDDRYIVQANGDPEHHYTWAVGDGRGKYGVTNLNSISIEICSNLRKGTSSAKPNHPGWTFTEEAIANAVKLTKYLMRKYSIDADHVIRHYDATRKLCPGIVGWNPGILFAEDGTQHKTYNNEIQWVKFKARIM